MLKLSHFVLKSATSTSRLNCITRLSLSSVVAEVKNPAESGNLSGEARRPKVPKSANIVAAAFASLNSETVVSEISTPVTDDKIAKATSVDDLLAISSGNGVSRKLALRVVSVLADWTAQGKVSLTEFEADPRFIRLCKVLTKTSAIKNMRNSLAAKSEDLSTVLSVTADDEAAKLVSSITVPQMVKVMTTLSSKKRRSTLLLRTLSYNITASSDKLDLKQSADLLYSMSTLNFLDENLLSKIATDSCHVLEQQPVTKSAAIGSILTSVGLLKYKNCALLDALCDWIEKNHAISRPQDVFAMFMTLAVLNYKPSNADGLFSVLVPQLSAAEAGDAVIWLDLVWSLVLLEKASNEHVKSVLDKGFVDKILAENPTSMSIKLKLLNINGATALLKNYTGPKLAQDSDLKSTKILRTKEKNEMVGAIVDSLKNLIQSEGSLRYNVNTGLGFYIDAECLMDKKCNSLPLNDSSKNGVRIALMSYDYHDMCKGRVEPIGTNILAKKLLESQGYQLLEIPYTDFKPRDKLIHRVKYLETKLKEIVARL